jgi:hypothetical protein
VANKRVQELLDLPVVDWRDDADDARRAAVERLVLVVAALAVIALACYGAGSVVTDLLGQVARVLHP